jgi:hypothetical protein
VKKTLRTDLLDERITQLVGFDNDEQPKIYFLHAPESTSGAYIEYEIYDEQEAYHDENTEKAVTYFIQVDIFSPKDYSLIEEAVKTVLKEKKYDGGLGPDLYESDTKLYHKPLRFTYTKMLD